MDEKGKFFQIKSREFLSQNKLFFLPLLHLHPSPYTSSYLIFTFCQCSPLCCFAHHILFSSEGYNASSWHCCCCWWYFFGLKTHFTLLVFSVSLFSYSHSRWLRWYIHLNKIRLNSLPLPLSLEFFPSFSFFCCNTHAAVPNISHILGSASVENWGNLRFMFHHISI